MRAHFEIFDARMGFYDVREISRRAFAAARTGDMVRGYVDAFYISRADGLDAS